MLTYNGYVQWFDVTMIYTRVRTADESDMRKAVGGLLSSVPERVNMTHNHRLYSKPDRSSRVESKSYRTIWTLEL